MTTLQTVTAEQANKETPFGENFETISAAGIFAKRQPATSGLTWAFYGGLYNGNTIADGTVALTNTSDNYVVVLRSTGVVSASTSSANSVNPLYAKLYKVTCAAGLVSAVVDQRWDANGLMLSGGGSSVAANVPATRYTIELLNTTDSDPGPGLLKFNNATPASATFLYVDDATSDGVDLSTYFLGLGATGYVTIQSVADAGEWAIFKWTAITDGTGYFKFAVTSYASLGTLDDADPVLVSFDSDANTTGALLAANNLSDLASLATATATLQSTGLVADSVGYRNIPQNSKSAAYTFVAADSGKHILHPSADITARIFTIDSNANVAYPIGTAITIVNQNAAGAITIAITTDTMRLAGAGTTGSRTLAANGVATALKIAATEWIISGTGLT